MEVNDEDGDEDEDEDECGGVCEIGWFRVNKILLLRLMRF